MIAQILRTLVRRSRRSAAGWLAATLVLVMAAGCTARVDVSEQLEVIDVTTGWFDAGIVDGKNKLVPTISFRLRNRGDRPIASVQVNAVFRRMGEDEAWGDAFLQAIGSAGVPPGQATDPIVLRSHLGYTGEQPRAEMLQHSDFVDAQVELYARHRSPQWISLGEFTIDRQLLTN